ncbi:sterol desaturase family protein [Halanaerobacter jeridensis]|uniref:Fatty acid hydroxylase domain-containing protein n=1 Tax=Halanaerobacter jeridensis TaxID=706427 RepID=A0A938XS11_9FIRM|nr:sterol desaturase family protein [Halanaerobacter jeridensis]MBM7556420.1 hypothetical protein [Halanaerobacter jeridensis]
MGRLMIIIIAYLYATFIEYCVHRFYIHDLISHQHSEEHHQEFDSNKIRFRDNEANPEDVLATFDYLILQVICASPGIILLWWTNRFNALLVLAVILIYIVWTEIIHLHFHWPTQAIIEKNNLFKTLQWHHKIHHRNQKNNFGIGSELWDYLFSTKQTRN